VLRGVREDDALLQMRARCDKRAEIGRRRAQRQVRRQAEARVLSTVGPPQELPPELLRDR
jgi:hypothetical protein